MNQISNLGILYFLITLQFIYACSFSQSKPSELPASFVTSQKISDIQKSLKIGDLKIDDLAKPGPFPIEKTSLKIELEMEKQNNLKTPNKTVDAFQLKPKNLSQSPDIVVFVHGNGGSSKDLLTTASITSSWGFQSIILNLPAVDKWVYNGILLRKILEKLKTNHKESKLYLVAFSFGATAASIALNDGAKVDLLVLLDPALYSPTEEHKLTAFNNPVIILGSDKNIFRTKSRNAFFENISSNVIEVDIVGATHEDAIEHYTLNKFLPWMFNSPRKELFRSSLIYSLLFNQTLDGDKLIISQLDQLIRSGHMKDLKIKINHKWNTP